MSYAESRIPYEFSADTKKEAWSRQKVCEGCGAPHTKDNPLQADHIIPIWWGLKYNVFALEVIRSLSNLRILCRDCHSKRSHYDETEIMALANVVMIRFVEEERTRNANSRSRATV